ncbi:hypothetical protein [Streptomyces sp. NPDC006463]|uniref:hypothetical protein n=1 Tax=Streptomyces sp. NPDC006463 TaxID=3364746 RepID=UPI00369A8C9F
MRATVRRGIELPYGLHGTVMVTGPQFQELDTDLVAEVQGVCVEVAEVRAEWQDRPPASEGAVRAELLAAAGYARKCTARSAGLPRLSK